MLPIKFISEFSLNLYLNFPSGNVYLEYRKGANTIRPENLSNCTVNQGFIRETSLRHPPPHTQIFIFILLIYIYIYFLLTYIFLIIEKEISNLLIKISLYLFILSLFPFRVQIYIYIHIGICVLNKFYLFYKIPKYIPYLSKNL